MTRFYQRLRLSLISIFSLLFSASLQANTPGSIEWQTLPSLEKIFSVHNGNATFVVYDREKQCYYGYNQQRAETRYRPASSFKIANSLIAFETGIIKNTTQIFPYDGQPKSLKSWEKAMTIKEAIAVSNLPLYQDIARQIGQQQMQKYIGLINYGNTKIANVEKINNAFWIDGPLAISAIEQVNFIEGLLQHQWPLSTRSYDLVRQIMPQQKSDRLNSTLFFKTGLGNKPSPQIGWVVGWINLNDKTYPFALNMDIDNVSQIGQRINIVRLALKQLDFY